MQAGTDQPNEPAETKFYTYCHGVWGQKCGRLISIQSVPWMGSPEASSHGLCSDCQVIFAQQVDDLDRTPCSNCEKPARARKDPNEEPLCNSCERILFEPSYDPRQTAECVASPLPLITRDLQPQANRKPFGTGFAEIPSSEIAQRVRPMRSVFLPAIHDPRPLFYFGAVCALLLVGAIADILI